MNAHPDTLSTDQCQPTNAAPEAAPQRAAPAAPAAVVRPRVDLFETDASYFLRVEVPGADESQVDIQVERDVLTLSAVADLPIPAGFQSTYGTAGRRRYERAFKLAEDVDVTRIDAEVKSGLLTLALPKVQPSVHKVSVKRAQ